MDGPAQMYLPFKHSITTITYAQVLKTHHNLLAKEAGTPVGMALAPPEANVGSLQDWYETFRIVQARTAYPLCWHLSTHACIVYCTCHECSRTDPAIHCIINHARNTVQCSDSAYGTSGQSSLGQEIHHLG